MSDFHVFEEPPEPPPRRKLGGCVIALLVVVGFGVVVGAAVIGGLIYIGAKGPETSVYVGSQVPTRFYETMNELGALESDEELLYFYSDGLVDITGGFYFVSDRKVAIYIEDAAVPLQTVRFEEIEGAELTRDTSFMTDSQIVLTLKDGDSLWFPVSSEMDRDTTFHEAIVSRLGR